jgi:hypothetical protein
MNRDTRRNRQKAGQWNVCPRGCGFRTHLKWLFRKHMDQNCKPVRRRGGDRQWQDYDTGTLMANDG